jgi:MSHA biogenesis protein MshM
MYQDFFQLQEMPFSLTPDTEFFLSYGHFHDALNTLLVAINSGEGFIKVTGEIGTGKTMLCRKLLRELGDDHYLAYIPNPSLSPEGLVRAVAEELELDISASDEFHHVLKEITHRLIELNDNDAEKGVVLCIDESQSMSLETLETMRLLTNLETEKRKLLQVVLFGQPELDEKLDQSSMRQLKQRITFSYKLEPLDKKGIETYIKHRLETAGGENIIFEPKAIKLLHSGSRGYPRLINILSHKAMMLGFGEGTKIITKKHIQGAINDTDGAYRPRFWGLFG